MSTAKYGCQLPQDSSNIKRVFEVAVLCEKLGYDSVWVYDHLAPFWLPSKSCLESWSLLSAVAAETSTVKIGTLVTNVNLRNPALLAKMASTVDTISGGRLILGLGIGDKMSIQELHSYGYKFPTLNERVTLLREHIQLLRSLWSGTQVTFKGKLVNVTNAICLPKPKQDPGPPIWVGGRHRAILDVVAELADGWNYWGLTRHRLTELDAYLRKQSTRQKRDYETIVRSWAGTVATPTSNASQLMESMKAELISQTSHETSYFITSFHTGAEDKAYECFAEAVGAVSRWRAEHE